MRRRGRRPPATRRGSTTRTLAQPSCRRAATCTRRSRAPRRCDRAISVWNRWSRFSSAPSTCVSTASGSSAATSRRIADMTLDGIGAVATLEVRVVDADVAQERIGRVAETRRRSAPRSCARCSRPMRGRPSSRTGEAVASDRDRSPSRPRRTAAPRAKRAPRQLRTGGRGEPGAARRDCHRAGARAPAPKARRPERPTAH